MIAVGSASCGDAAEPVRSAAVIDDVVHWRGAVKLEENRQVINVFPQVSFAPGGAYLVADGREAQVRVYGSAGELRSWFGTRGEGPGEFYRPTAALPHFGGTVLTVDMLGKYAVHDTAARRVIETGQFPVPIIYTAKPLPNDQLLLVGRTSGTGSPHLHVWDLREKRLVRRFFVPPVRGGFEHEAVMNGVMDVAVRGDSIAALFALSDSIFLFTRNGARVGALPVRARGLRPMEEKFPGGGREALVKWQGSFSMMSRVFWLSDGSFLVQYYDMAANEQRFSLVRVRRDGEPIFEVQGTPRLLAVAPDGETLLFTNPAAEMPNQWRLATLR
ncbi:MAG TPA: hypothetical protein VFS20_11590 [Longimicrobium sp.]|nr:hypothetical protein [Longimicrobium sp.]